jgi:hypothetical protein
MIPMLRVFSSGTFLGMMNVVSGRKKGPSRAQSNLSASALEVLSYVVAVSIDMRPRLTVGRVGG